MTAYSLTQQPNNTNINKSLSKVLVEVISFQGRGKKKKKHQRPKPTILKAKSSVGARNRGTHLFWIESTFEVQSATRHYRTKTPSGSNMHYTYTVCPSKRRKMLQRLHNQSFQLKPLKQGTLLGIQTRVNKMTVQIYPQSIIYITLKDLYFKRHDLSNRFFFSILKLI